MDFAERLDVLVSLSSEQSRHREKQLYGHSTPTVDAGQRVKH